ncbi:MAG TPA: NADH-quinone oxidoreductase subunit C [Candidatus Binatia bacterium]|jgi:NADH-quinone oxidoreductase subunit C
MSESSARLDYIKEKLGRRVLAVLLLQGDEVLILDRASLRESFRLFKEDSNLRLDFLSDITAVDYWKKKEPRFEVVYQVASLKGERRLRVRVPVPEEDAAVESLTPLWQGANFLEREVWDLFGIRFIDHPDLRRILLYDEFQGHPLRKDYPVNLWQPRVPEREVAGTFVDERSQNKLTRLKQTFSKKS